MRAVGDDSCGTERPYVRAFLAKAVFDVLTTRPLVERLGNDPQLHRLYGWERPKPVKPLGLLCRALWRTLCRLTISDTIIVSRYGASPAPNVISGLLLEFTR